MMVRMLKHIDNRDISNDQIGAEIDRVNNLTNKKEETNPIEDRFDILDL